MASAFLPCFREHARKLQPRKLRVAAGAIGDDGREFLFRAAVLASGRKLHGAFVALAGRLRCGNASVLHKLVAEHADHDQRRARKEVRPVLFPEPLETLAPDFFFDFAEKIVVLVGHAGVSP